MQIASIGHKIGARKKCAKYGLWAPNTRNDDRLLGVPVGKNRS